MLTFKKNNSRKNEKGMAFIEAIPVLFIVVIVFNFSLGFFGAIHSGILNSIASYNYTLETFRFRSNLMYFRPGGGMTHYALSMNRVHGVTADGVRNDDTSKKLWPATVRQIAFANISNPSKMSLGIDPDAASHAFKDKGNNKNVWFIKSDYSPDGPDESAVSPEIWIKTIYGICLNAECKP